MVDKVIFTNPEHSHVRVEPEGWSMSYPSKTWHMERVTQWEEGRTDEWDAQKEAYDNYVAIMSYKDSVALYETGMQSCQDSYTSCKADELSSDAQCEHELLSCQATLTMPIKPSGYYTQEEVDASQAKWDAWNVLPVDERGREPVVLKIPANLPIVAAPAPLVPNVIVDYIKPITEVIGEKVAELTTAFDKEANADVISNGKVWKGGASSAMLLDGQANKISHRGKIKGIIHSKDHKTHELTPNEIKDVAADVADAYSNAYGKYQAKLLELDICGTNEACIMAITW